MRITRVAAEKPETKFRLRPAPRWTETAALLVASCLVGAGLWQVYRSKAEPLAAAERRIASGEVMLLRAGAMPAEIAPHLLQYQDAKQRRFVAAQISRRIRDEVPGNVGTLATIHITRADAERGGVLSFYEGRLSGAERIRLFTGEEFARLKSSFAVRTPAEFRSAFRRWVFLFFAVFWAAHVVWILFGFRGDPHLLPPVFLATGAGLILMVSLRDPVRDFPIFTDFGFGVSAGCLLIVAITVLSHLMDLRSRGLLKSSAAGAFLDSANGAARQATRRGDLAFAASIVLSILLLLFGSGPGGADVKVRLGFFQPVEVIRFLLVLFLASYFARRWEFLRELREKRIQTRVNLPRLDHALPVMIAVAVAIAFFFLQKDLGPAVILASLFLCLYAVARLRAGLVLAALAVLFCTGWLAYKIGYPPIAVTRIGMWLEPWSNGLTHGEQVVHGFWAMAGGRFLGAGIGAGQPELIPAAHTDLILAALAEEAGFLGLVLIAGALVWLIWRGLRISLRAAAEYEFFLALGLTLALALEAAFIAGGVLGILPLTGVVTPFLSYGSTAMIVNFACVGVLLAISAKESGRPGPNPQFQKPVAVLAGILCLFTITVIAKAAWIQVVRPDKVIAAGTLVLREDGSYALAYNPRLLAVAHQIPRGTIYDRNGLPLATSRWDELQKHKAEYAALGIDIERACIRGDARCYPLGAAAFQLLGDLRTRARWSASNAAFEEKVSRGRLQGYNDREVLDTIELPRVKKQVRVLRYDYSELVPLLRARMDPSNEAVRKVLDAPRDVRLTVDARLQLRLTRAFRDYLRANAWKSGAVVVIHPASGELLAAVSVPLPENEPAVLDPPAKPALDLARFGEYPPGSAFKLVTAIAALRLDPALADKKYECVRLPDGRVGNRVRGRIIRDDPQDKQAHGKIDLRQGLIRSCNAFFSQLGTYDVGAEQLLATAQLFNIDTAKPNTAKHVNDDLPQAAYGQGEVLVTPLRLARVSGAIAAGGRLAAPRIRLTPPDPAEEPRAILDAALASRLQAAMRAVVTSGTGREAMKAPVAIAGKTGTAELAKAPAHAWFTGYAPFGAPVEDRVAFAILIENARYGGRAAAPFAAQVAGMAMDVMKASPRFSREEAQ